MVSLSAKCSDLCFIEYRKKRDEGYVPKDMGIGGGDYIDFRYYLECGQIQGDWPSLEPNLEHVEGEEEE